MIFSVLLVFTACTLPKRTRIACVGDSITWGAGIPDREHKSYPARLQQLLGEDYEVVNFGHNGATLLTRGNIPYVRTEEYKASMAFNPDIVLIMLGTNDSKKVNRPYLVEYKDDYARLIESYRQLPSHPRVILLKPVPAFNYGDTVGITPGVVARRIVPMVEQVAYDQDCEVVDLFHWFLDKEPMFPDRIHPNADGAERLARRLQDYLLRPEESFDLHDHLSLSGTPQNFHGFPMVTGQLDSVTFRIVFPRRVAPGRPWLWRARFFGHEPQTDIAMLERGYHVVYYDVAGFFGAPPAVARWDRFWSWLQKGGLAPRTALEGMSRGGLIVYNWAYHHPDRVCCVYADAPVLDIKSWPGGKGHGKGSPSDWQQCLRAYGFATEEEAVTARVNPLDRADSLARAGFPMLHIVGDADRVVPVDENTGPFAKIIREHGGKIKVIHKPGIGHHPHSLPDPEPIVRFIEEACHVSSQ